jgi:hypothetical protein
MRSPKFPAEHHRPDVASIDCWCRIACGRLRNPRRRHPFHLVRPTYSPRRTAPNMPFEFGLRFLKNFFPVHRSTIPPLVKTLSSSRGERCQRRVAGAGRHVREATNIGANEDAPSDGKEIDPEGRKGRGGPSVEFGEDSIRE